MAFYRSSTCQMSAMKLVEGALRNTATDTSKRKNNWSKISLTKNLAFRHVSLIVAGILRLWFVLFGLNANTRSDLFRGLFRHISCEHVMSYWNTSHTVYTYSQMVCEINALFFWFWPGTHDTSACANQNTICMSDTGNVIKFYSWWLTKQTQNTPHILVDHRIVFIYWIHSFFVCPIKT